MQRTTTLAVSFNAAAPACYYKQARNESMDWLLHIDPDEVAYPINNPSFSLAADLGSQPPYVGNVRHMNYEAVVEASDFTNRWEQATLFNPHGHMVDESLHGNRYATRVDYLILHVLLTT